MSLADKVEKKLKILSYKILSWNRAIYLQRTFDNLIANEDRHQKNIRITGDWRMILIDHSRSFRFSKRHQKKLIFTEKHPEGPKLMKRLPRAVVDKIKALDLDKMNELCGEYLTEPEITAVLARREEDMNGDGKIDMVSIFVHGKLVRREIFHPEVVPL